MTLSGSLRSHLKELFGLNDPSKLTLEDLRLELTELGLLGKPFGPEEYRTVLEGRLGIEIHLEELPDVERGALTGLLGAEGNLAEVVIDEESGNAVVLVWESLHYQPWPASYALSIFHALSAYPETSILEKMSCAQAR